jgi:dTDP-glucose pyrophosphorylase
MTKLGITDVIVVVGHLGYEIARVLGGGEQFGVRIRYVEQKEILGIAHAVAGLEGYISGPFLLFLGDIFFDTTDLSEMIHVMRDRDAAAVLAVKEEETAEAVQRNFAVLLGEDNFVKRVIEKPRYTACRLKGCGLYLFDLPIFDAIRRTPRTAMRNEYEITDSIQILLDDGYRVSAANVVREDINVTYPSDLLECNLMELRKQQRENIVSETAVINRNAVVRNSVIGHEAEISNPIAVRNSLVFERTAVSSSLDIDRAIIMPDAVIDCRTAAFAATVH